LIFLTVGISFSYLTFLTVTDGSGNGMAAFSPIKLGQNAPAVIFIISRYSVLLMRPTSMIA
jgi:hypothetical protein